MTNGIVFKAGAAAFRSLRDDGFEESRIGSIVGASGGAKWLVLSQLDRVIVSRLLPKLEAPVHTLGSSIGAWRFACYARRDPLAAIVDFERAYLEQTYSEKPDVREITDTSRRILTDLVGPNGVEEILTNPTLRTHIMTVRARHLTASEQPVVQGAGLAMAMTANAISRRALGAFFSRALFTDPRDEPPFLNATGFPIDRVALRPDNLVDAVMASGAIPMVLSGVRNIAGAPAGIYRDGGIIDYHLDLPTAAADRITLYPHFFDWLKPGWFDKQLRWRNVDPANFERTLLICPSPDFIAALPGGKVPDRQDFVSMPPDVRVRSWREVIAACEALAEELNDVLDRGLLPALVEPL